MVNTENVAMLCDALESGEYEQGTGWLTHHDPETGKDKDCCLGVATKVAIKHGIQVETKVINGITYYKGNASTLCEEVQKFYGFTSSNPTLTTELWNSPAAAAALNDGLDGYDKHDFPTISRYFRSTYL